MKTDILMNGSMVKKPQHTTTHNNTQLEGEPEPSWVAFFIERMDQRLDANERRIELRMDERLDANERRIEHPSDTIGQTWCRVVFAKTVAGRPSVGNWSPQEKWC